MQTNGKPAPFFSDKLWSLLYFSGRCIGHNSRTTKTRGRQAFESFSLVRDKTPRKKNTSKFQIREVERSIDKQRLLKSFGNEKKKKKKKKKCSGTSLLRGRLSLAA